MARLHGRNGQLLRSATSTGSYTAIANLRSWTLDLSTDRVDSTCMNDTFRQTKQGLPAATGTMEGVADDATDGLTSLYSDAITGATAFYRIQPTTGVTEGWQFQGEVDLSFSSAVDALVTFSGSFSATAAVSWTNF